MSEAVTATNPAAVRLSSPSLKRNVLSSWGAHGLSLVIGFFLMPYVLGVLGDQQYGNWVFINSFASYAALLYFGFGETISRYVAKFQAEGRPQQVNEVASLVMAVFLGTGGLALLIALLLCWFAPSFGRWNGDELLQVRIVMLILGLNVAAGLSGSVFGGVLIGLRRFDLERSVAFAFDLVRLTLILIFLRQTWGLVIIATIFLLITVCEQITYAVLAFQIYPPLRIRPACWKWSTWRECSGFSAMSFLNTIAAQVINASDSIVIGLMLGTQAIVPYYLALRLTQFIRQPIDKIAHICMPTAGALAVETDQRRLHKLLMTSCGAVLLLIGGMFIGGWFFGADLIRVWMGPGYPQSHRILCILLGAQVVALPCGVLRAFLFGAGRVRVLALIYVLEAACNLALSIFLCQRWGVEGVAWGTALPVVVVELGLLLPYALRQFGLSFGRLWKQAIWPQLPPLALLASYAWLAVQLPWLPVGWPGLIGATLVGGAVLGAGWLAVRHTTRPVAD